MTRRVLLVLAAAAALLGIAPVPGTGAQTPGTVTADSEGWWQQLSGATAPPGSPLRGVAPPLTGPAPDVPEGSVPVAIRLGQVDKVGAIGIVLEGIEPGAVVNRFTMTLQEVEETTAQQGDPAVVACPITTFFVPESNGDMANAPDADCDLARAEGVPNGDGSWTFDLAAIASVWLDPFSAVPPNGVRLDPVGEPPATFQVAFTGFEDATFDVDFTPGEPAEDPFAVEGDGFESPPPTTGGGFSGGGSTGGGSFSGTTGGGFESPVPETPAPVDTGTDAAAPTPDPVTTTADTIPASETRAGETLGNLPLGAWLALGLGLLLALAAAWSLGPEGRRRPELSRRRGGVSRALAGRVTHSVREA